MAHCILKYFIEIYLYQINDLKKNMMVYNETNYSSSILKTLIWGSSYIGLILYHKYFLS